MGIINPLKSKDATIVYSVILAVLIIIMLLAIRLTVMKGHEEIKETVLNNIGSMQKSFGEGADSVMRDAGQEIIRLKAEKVAKEIENYLISHPLSTIKSMQNDPEFKSIAIQPIGKTGYTAVHESKTSINRFHINPKIVNTNLAALADKLPDFWKIISASRNGENIGGYYNWREADGRVREKYMWVAMVYRPTADGIFLDVAATTYIDEFMQPFEQFTKHLKSESAKTSEKVSSLTQRIQQRTLVVSVAIVLIFCGILIYTAFRLIRDYRLIKIEVQKREEAEAVLRDSEHRLKELIDFFPDPTFAIDCNKCVTVWNRAMEKMTGVPSVQIIGEGNYAYSVPFYGERRNILMDLLWEEGDVIEKKYSTVMKDGDALIAETFCPALYGGKGAYVYAKASPLRDMNGNIIGAIEAVRDITKRKKSEQELSRKDKYLESVSQAVTELLVNPDLNEAMQKTLSILGTGTGHDRAYIFQNHIGEDGTPLMSQRYEWALDAVSAQIDNPAMKNLPYDGTFAQMYEKLINKEYFYGETASFDDDTRQMLENQDIQSIVIFPIFSSNKYWGFVGFDSCSKVREYSQSELSIIYTFAETMGESVAMKKAEEELRQHTEELEQFMKLTIDRELKMIELKEEINALIVQMGKDAKYEISE